MTYKKVDIYRKLRLFAERHACFGASLIATVATTSGDNERGDSGRGRCWCKRVVERTASIVTATTPWPRRGDSCACGCPRRTKPARN